MQWFFANFRKKRLFMRPAWEVYALLQSYFLSVPSPITPANFQALTEYSSILTAPSYQHKSLNLKQPEKLRYLDLQIFPYALTPEQKKFHSITIFRKIYDTMKPF